MGGAAYAEPQCARERAAKLESHFRQAQDDVGQIATSAEKVTRRAARIDAMEFSEEAPKVEAQPNLRLATGRE
jgi:DNA recombination protein RmuC